MLPKFNILLEPVPWVATTETWAHARARGAGFHGPVKTPLLALVKGLRNPATMTVEQEGGGGGKGRKPETSKQPAGRPGPEGQGSAERPQKYSPVRRESRGTRSVVRGKGEVGGAEGRETGTARIKREVERRVTTGIQHLPTRRRTQDHRGHRKNQEGNRASGVGMHLAASG